MSSSAEQQISDGQRFGIPELIPLRLERQESVLDAMRLNFVIPAISKKSRASGGVTTAFRLLDRFLKEFTYIRLVVTHERVDEVDLGDWEGWAVDEGNLACRSIAFLPERNGSLPVASLDCFIATYWSTATYVRQVVEQQRQWFPEAIRRHVYFIQEFEPAFYPGSARYEYALSTYRDDGSVIAIFNSTPVERYFKQKGLHFSEEYTFDPMFNPRLHQKKVEFASIAKERLILVYGRPGIPQNDIDLAVESLRKWVDAYCMASNWLVVTAGLPHADVPLGRGMSLRSLGTLSLDDYAKYLARCWAGISFTFNASTSYTTREMAEFGAWVLTNQFEHRKREDLPRNVLVLDEPTPDKVAQMLIWCCEQYRLGSTVVAPGLGPVFKRGGEEFPFVEGLLKSWLAGSR